MDIEMLCEAMPFMAGCTLAEQCMVGGCWPWWVLALPPDGGRGAAPRPPLLPPSFPSPGTTGSLLRVKMCTLAGTVCGEGAGTTRPLPGVRCAHLCPAGVVQPAAHPTDAAPARRPHPPTHPPHPTIHPATLPVSHHCRAAPLLATIASPPPWRATSAWTCQRRACRLGLPPPCTLPRTACSSLPAIPPLQPASHVHSRTAVNWLRAGGGPLTMPG